MIKYIDYNREKFALNLRALMEGKSILAFSKCVGIQEKTINGWINKKYSPSIEFLFKLAQYFDCSIDYLVGLKDY